MPPLASGARLETVVHTLVLQNQHLCQQVERLSSQVAGLERSRAELAKQFAAAARRHDELREQVEVVAGDQADAERQVDDLAARTCALEEDYEDVDRRLPDIAMQAEDTVREYTEEALRALVVDLIEDYIDDERPRSVQELVDAAVQDRIAAITDRILDTLRAAVVPS